MRRDKGRDWDALRERYVQSSLTLPELSKETDIPLPTLQRHSHREGWVALRRQYTEDVSTKTRLLGADRAAKDKLNSLKEAEQTCKVLSSAIDAIATKVQGENFKVEVGKIEAHKILERLSSVSTAQDKILRVIELLKGGPDSRPAVDLANLLSGTSD